MTMQLNSFERALSGSNDAGYIRLSRSKSDKIVKYGTFFGRTVTTIKAKDVTTGAENFAIRDKFAKAFQSANASAPVLDDIRKTLHLTGSDEDQAGSQSLLTVADAKKVLKMASGFKKREVILEDLRNKGLVTTKEQEDFARAKLGIKSEGGNDAETYSRALTKEELNKITQDIRNNNILLGTAFLVNANLDKQEQIRDTALARGLSNEAVNNFFNAVADLNEGKFNEKVVTSFMNDFNGALVSENALQQTNWKDIVTTKLAALAEASQTNGLNVDMERLASVIQKAALDSAKLKVIHHPQAIVDSNFVKNEFEAFCDNAIQERLNALNTLKDNETFKGLEPAIQKEVMTWCFDSEPLTVQQMDQLPLILNNADAIFKPQLQTLTNANASTTDILNALKASANAGKQFCETLHQANPNVFGNKLSALFLSRMTNVATARFLNDNPGFTLSEAVERKLDCVCSDLHSILNKKTLARPYFNCTTELRETLNAMKQNLQAACQALSGKPLEDDGMIFDPSQESQEFLKQQQGFESILPPQHIFNLAPTGNDVFKNAFLNNAAQQCFQKTDFNDCVSPFTSLSSIKREDCYICMSLNHGEIRPQDIAGDSFSKTTVNNDWELVDFVSPKAVYEKNIHSLFDKDPANGVAAATIIGSLARHAPSILNQVHCDTKQPYSDVIFENHNPLLLMNADYNPDGTYDIQMHYNSSIVSFKNEDGTFTTYHDRNLGHNFSRELHLKLSFGPDGSPSLSFAEDPKFTQQVNAKSDSYLLREKLAKQLSSGTYDYRANQENIAKVLNAKLENLMVKIDEDHLNTPFTKADYLKAMDDIRLFAKTNSEKYLSDTFFSIPSKQECLAFLGNENEEMVNTLFSTIQAIRDNHVMTKANFSSLMPCRGSIKNVILAKYQETINSTIEDAVKNSGLLEKLPENLRESSKTKLMEMLKAKYPTTLNNGIPLTLDSLVASVQAVCAKQLRAKTDAFDAIEAQFADAPESVRIYLKNKALDLKWIQPDFIEALATCQNDINDFINTMADLSKKEQLTQEDIRLLHTQILQATPVCRMLENKTNAIRLTKNPKAEVIGADEIAQMFPIIFNITVCKYNAANPNNPIAVSAPVKQALASLANIMNKAENMLPTFTKDKQYPIRTSAKLTNVPLPAISNALQHITVLLQEEWNMEYPSDDVKIPDYICDFIAQNCPGVSYKNIYNQNKLTKAYTTDIKEMIKSSITSTVSSLPISDVYPQQPLMKLIGETSQELGDQLLALCNQDPQHGAQLAQVLNVLTPSYVDSIMTDIQVKHHYGDPFPASDISTLHSQPSVNVRKSSNGDYILTISQKKWISQIIDANGQVNKLDCTSGPNYVSNIIVGISFNDSKTPIKLEVNNNSYYELELKTLPISNEVIKKLSQCKDPQTHEDLTTYLSYSKDVDFAQLEKIALPITTKDVTVDTNSFTLVDANDINLTEAQRLDNMRTYLKENVVIPSDIQFLENEFGISKAAAETMLRQEVPGKVLTKQLLRRLQNNDTRQQALQELQELYQSYMDAAIFQLPFSSLLNSDEKVRLVNMGIDLSSLDVMLSTDVAHGVRLTRDLVQRLLDPQTFMQASMDFENLYQQYMNRNLITQPLALLSMNDYDNLEQMNIPQDLVKGMLQSNAGNQRLTADLLKRVQERRNQPIEDFKLLYQSYQNHANSVQESITAFLTNPTLSQDLVNEYNDKRNQLDQLNQTLNANEDRTQISNYQKFTKTALLKDIRNLENQLNIPPALRQSAFLEAGFVANQNFPITIRTQEF